MPTRSVRVRFRASKEFLARVGLDPDVERVEDSPSVALPTQLSRAGLTEVVRQLWEETRPDVEVPTGKLEFRDVARDELIRGGAMEKYLTKHGVTEEETIVLEYAPPVGAPMEVGEGSPVPDWLACVAAASAATRTSTLVVGGSFDGSLVVAADASDGRGAQVLVTEKVAHGAAIKDVCFFGTDVVVTASKDATLGVWRLASNSNNEPAMAVTRVATCVGHADAVETVCAAPSSTSSAEALLLTGGWDGQLRLYEVNTEAAGDGAASVMTAKKSAKRRATSAGPARLVKPSMSLGGHTDKISGACWGGSRGSKDPITAFTSSWDHTVRTWDVVRQVETLALQSPKPATCLDFHHARGLLASGHPDHIVRLWDAREGGDSVVKLTMKDHNGWVSSVAFEADDSPLLASASHDRSVRVWDVRVSARPLAKIENVMAGQMFGVAWGSTSSSSKSLYLAGSEPSLRTYAMASTS